MRKTALPLIALLLSACTTVDYRSPELAPRTRDHQTIAVLPFEMVFVGKAPAGLTAERIAEIEENESLAFQTAFYHRLLNRSSADRRNRILVDVQPAATTNRILYEQGIGVRESWHRDTEELAEVLGVDAVVRTTVQKTRYLSDIASYGIDTGLYVLHEVTDGFFDPVIPPGLTKTHDIWIDSALLDGEDGDLLWQVALARATDWRRPANDVVVGVTRKLARKFPYRG